MDRSPSPGVMYRGGGSGSPMIIERNPGAGMGGAGRAAGPTMQHGGGGGTPNAGAPRGGAGGGGGAPSPSMSHGGGGAAPGHGGGTGGAGAGAGGAQLGR